MLLFVILRDRFISGRGTAGVPPSTAFPPNKGPLVAPNPPCPGIHGWKIASRLRPGASAPKMCRAQGRLRAASQRGATRGGSDHTSSGELRSPCVVSPGQIGPGCVSTG